MRKLQRTGFGEMHAVAGAQPPNLAFEVGPLHREASLVVDEAVPDIDVHDARPRRPRPINLIEVGDVAIDARTRARAVRPTGPARPWP